MADDLQSSGLRRSAVTVATSSQPQREHGLKCPRCDSPNTKFCYYNNYSLAQPRHFCKSCRRYWTRGGALRDVPVDGGSRKNKKSKSSSSCHPPMDSTPDARISAGGLNFLGGLPASALDGDHSVNCPTSDLSSFNAEGSFVSSTESQSSIDRDLQRNKLQQQRLASLLGMGGKACGESGSSGGTNGSSTWFLANYCIAPASP